MYPSAQPISRWTISARWGALTIRTQDDDASRFLKTLMGYGKINQRKLVVQLDHYSVVEPRQMESSRLASVFS